MQNYHRHTSYSNIMTPDSAASNEDYAKRAVELGQKVLSSVEHGWQGYYYEVFELAQKYDLKFIFGTEAYWVHDNLEKDKTNNHIIILAKNEQGRREINTILSDANIDGYYFKPRVDEKSIMSLTPGNVFITTACIAGWNYGFEETEDFVKRLYDRFGDDFKLEVQYHDTPRQKELNQFLLKLKEKYGIGLIAGLDSHYIYPEQAQDREYRLEASHIEYPEEDGWYMDYPSEEETIKRFQEQGILSEVEIQEAIEASDMLLQFEDIFFDKEVKLPVPPKYKDKTKEERAKIYSKLVTKKFKEYMKNVSESEYQRYYDGVKREVEVYKNTGMCDYPLIDYEIVKKGIEMGGVITSTGRGCFTEDAIALTIEGIKSIKDVKIGDHVIDMYGNPQRVMDTMEYDCYEEMLQINYAYGSQKNPLICTKDHKILIRDQNKNIVWKQAQNITNKDMVCIPRIHFPDAGKEYIDLNDFNDFGYEYDEQYIYEYRPSANGIVQYNTIEIAKAIGCSKAWVQQIIDHPERKAFKKPEYVSKLLQYTGFNSLEEYRSYIKKAHTIKINRFIKNDMLFNYWIGMMYGDGWTRSDKEKSTEIGFAVCTEGHKQKANKQIFIEMAERFNVPYSSRVAQDKKLEQLRMRSRLIYNFVSRYMFSSKKGKQKIFNPDLYNQDEANLLAIKEGLFLTDGSSAENRMTFDNTSTSLIAAYKILTMATERQITSMSVRPSHIDNRGFTSQTSYKLRIVPSRSDHPKSDYRTSYDEQYIYVPVWSVKNIEAKHRKVYDITVENSHSYVLDNIVVHNSAPSFMTNTLCGFSSIDRFQSPIKLYPERFMSETRILETHSLPD